MNQIYDVVVVGGGAAGLAAACRLQAAPVMAVVLEARQRIGGRGYTLKGISASCDLGCGWLHSADRNPLAVLARSYGFTIDTTPPPWDREAGGRPLRQPGWDEFMQALQAFEDKLAAAAHAPDRAAADFLEPGNRWNPLIHAFSTYYNGAAFDQVSVHDYAAYSDSGVNWRVLEGYGDLIAALARGSTVITGAPVYVVDHSGPTLRLETPQGDLRSRTAIITVPTSIIAGGRLAFRPWLPEKIDAACGLPLGHAEKLFLHLARPQDFPAETSLFGRTDQTDTGNYHIRPFGRSIVEGYMGGALARDLARQGMAAVTAFAVEELTALLGSSVRAQLSLLACSGWSVDLYAEGAYSHARPCHAGDRARLAQSVDDRLFFAGEACSPDAFSTAHGAFVSGLAAADEAQRALGVKLSQQPPNANNRATPPRM